MFGLWDPVASFRGFTKISFSDLNTEVENGRTYAGHRGGRAPGVQMVLPGAATGSTMHHSEGEMPGSPSCTGDWHDGLKLVIAFPHAGKKQRDCQKFTKTH